LQTINILYLLLFTGYLSPYARQMKNKLKVKTITANIRHTREELHYSQEYLAAKMGISQNAYSKIESGHIKITVERFLQIAFILKVEAAELINTDKGTAA